MRMLIASFFLTLLVSPVFSQIESQLWKAGWKAGKNRKMGNHEILKVEGIEKYGYTNIQYMSRIDVINETKRRADKEMWTAEKLQKTLGLFDSTKYGGRIVLSIGRITIGAANTKYFTIIIKDKDGNEVFRKKFDEAIPEVPSSGSEIWTNIKSESVWDVVLSTPFDVFIIDAIDDENPKTQFRVLN